mmetsp:Transcript_11575/g.28075  ORF Transcript_11575/g.28075 Transcript_11575/m.28075 type:complete len:221 (+) Transcript_11575:2114-2776(+)
MSRRSITTPATALRTAITAWTEIPTRPRERQKSGSSPLAPDSAAEVIADDAPSSAPPSLRFFCDSPWLKSTARRFIEVVRFCSMRSETSLISRSFSASSPPVGFLRCIFWTEDLKNAASAIRVNDDRLVTSARARDISVRTPTDRLPRRCNRGEPGSDSGDATRGAHDDDRGIGIGFSTTVEFDNRGSAPPPLDDARSRPYSRRSGMALSEGAFRRAGSI